MSSSFDNSKHIKVLEKNKKPLVTVIMNCSNGEFFLKKSIESVLNQTYKNWELIFWDNKSTDKSAEVFNSYKDKRLKYFYADKHTSLYKARNLAIDKATGDFISFLDTDDLWSENKLELQMPYFENPKVGVVFSNAWIFKKEVNNKRLYFKNKLPRGNIFDQLIKDYTVGIASVVMRKVLFTKLKEKFDERFSMIGDFDLFLRLSKLCIFESIQSPLAFARIHSKSLTQVMKEKETQEMEIWLKENKCNLNESYLKIIKEKTDYRKFVNFKIEGNYKECLKMLLNFKIKIFNIKGLIILFTPIVLLKKLLWYHQN